jgi:hypothetical protein
MTNEAGTIQQDVPEFDGEAAFLSSFDDESKKRAPSETDEGHPRLSTRPMSQRGLKRVSMRLPTTTIQTTKRLRSKSARRPRRRRCVS